MFDILFICMANIGRSQMAEGFYNYYSHGKNSISAGVKDFRKKYGYKPHPKVIEIMAEKGVDISNHKVNLINDKRISKAKKVILLMEEKEIDDKLREMLIGVNYKTISFPDPCPGNLNFDDSKEVIENTRIVRDKIEEWIKEML
jgi:arsenate reductase (thioredoxin)